jgi:hypothetical protein
MNAVPVWQCEAIAPEAREALFRQTQSFHALEQQMKRRWWAAGWIVGGVAMTVAAISMTTLMVTLHRWHPTPVFVSVDTSTGWVGEAVGALDAPKLFSDRVAAQYLRSYIEARRRTCRIVTRRSGTLCVQCPRVTSSADIRRGGSPTWRL